MNTIKLLKQYIQTFREEYIQGCDEYVPTKKVIAIVDYLLSCCEQHNVIPSRVSRSVIGGVGITFRKNKEEKDYIEIRNSGGISHLHSIYTDNEFKVIDVQDIQDTQFNAIIEVIKNRTVKLVKSVED